MKTIITLIMSAALATNVYAACQTTTVLTPDGKYVVCQTCCDHNGQNCNVICV